MKPNSQSISTLLFAAALALAAPAQARNGLDDPPGDDRGHGEGLEPGDDHGNHEVAGSVDDHSGRRSSLVDDTSDDSLRTKGRIFRTVNRFGTREEFRIDLKVRVPYRVDSSFGLNTRRLARSADIFASIRNAAGSPVAECKFEFDEFSGPWAEYRVRLVRRGTILRDKDGACDVDLTNAVADPGIPQPQNGTNNVEIYLEKPGTNPVIRETLATTSY